MIGFRVLSLVGTAICVIPTGFSHAQHHHHRHHHGHASGYRFVLPPNGRYGNYYTSNGVNYYAPVVVASSLHDHVVQQPVAVQYGGYGHLDDLAARLEDLANDFCLDLHYNYQHNPAYMETYREAFQILTTAKFIHGSEHAGDREAIRRSVGALDGLFHHVIDDVRPWSRHQHRQIGALTFGGKINEMESLIHHIMYDVGVKPAHDEPAEGAPPPGPSLPGPVPPPPAFNPAPMRESLPPR